MCVFGKNGIYILSFNQSFVFFFDGANFGDGNLKFESFVSNRKWIIKIFIFAQNKIDSVP